MSIFSNLRLFSAWLFALAALSVPVHAQERWALIVGNAAYTDSRVSSLQNTVNDARTMTSALSEMGFTVYLVENATKAAFESALDQIAQQQPGAEVGLFFFAGHGVQQAGVNYMLPTDLAPEGPDFLTEQAVSLDHIIARLAEAEAKRLVIILDACRDSPFGAGQAYGAGLALAESPPNTILSFATAPGDVALDGAGANSPFTAALASTLAGPRQDFRDVLRLVRAKVRRATEGSQTPWFIDNVTDEIWLEPNPPVALDPDLQASVTGEITLATITWNTIKSSADQTDFQLFVELFPQNQLAPVASRQLQLLEESGGLALRGLDILMDDPNLIVPGGLSLLVTQCDILATAPRDGFALVEPVPHDLVNTRAALRACIQALQEDPDNGRLMGHLARVLMLEGRTEEGLHYLREAIAHGYTNAYGSLGEAYRIGRGVEIDYERAADYILQGALAGNAALRVVVAEFYKEGWGVPQSFAEARRWYEIASKQGQFHAYTALGDMYRRGQGVEVDFGRALELYLTAAVNGESDAMNNVGLIYLRGQGMEPNHQQALFWLTRAMGEGNPYAAFHLGRMFRTGWAVDKDPAQAIAYFRLSAQRNFVDAYEMIGQMLEGEDGLPADLPLAYANYIIAFEGGMLRNTAATREVAGRAAERMAALETLMSADDLLVARAQAQEWIDNYGVLDFNLVNR